MLPGTLATLGTCVALGGCAVGRNQSDLLTARLRQSSAQMQRMESDLIAARDELRFANEKLAQAKSAAAQTQLAGATTTSSPAKTLEFHTRLTALQDDDQSQGTETITAFVTPRDAAGKPTMIDGQLELVARDAQTQSVVVRWFAEGPQLSRYWYNGFLGSGYQITIRSPQALRPESVRIEANYTDPAGQAVTATHSFSDAAGIASTKLRGTGSPASFTDPQETRRPAYESLADEGSEGDAVPDPLDMPDRSMLAPTDERTLRRAAELGPTSVNWTDETMPIRR
jgi:hypothetical protein